MSSTKDVGVLLVAHGTVVDVSQLPSFLSEIRRGRPPPPEMVAEMTHRYLRIGGSPLLEITHQQARALEELTQLRVLIGMRFGTDRIECALEQASKLGLRRLVTLPLAPYSARIYVQEVERRLDDLKRAGSCAGLELIKVGDWGQHPRLIAAHAASIVAALAKTPSDTLPIVVTAHSLPLQVINAGDPYATLVGYSVAALRQVLGRNVILAYQSQGDVGGTWLGPSLRQVLQSVAETGHQEVVVSPIGFLSEHVETLYDLDHEAAAYAGALRIAISRVPALNATPELIMCLKDLVDSALTC